MRLMRRYANAVTSGLAARAVVGVSGVVQVWLITNILGKELFAFCMLGFTAVQLPAMIISASFMWLVLFRVSPLMGDEGRETGRRMTGALLFSNIAASTLLAVLAFIFADAIAGLFDKPEVAWWVQAMCAIILLRSVTNVMGAYYQARQEIVYANFFRDMLPHIVRIILLAIVWLVGWGAVGVAASLVSGVFVSAVAAYALRPVPFALPHHVLGKEDLKYGGTMALTSVAEQRNRGVGVLLIGALASPAVTAEFVIATQLAPLLSVMANSLNNLLTPRLGMHLASGSSDGLTREYAGTRLTSLIICIGGAGVFLLFGPFILSLYGDDFESTYPMLLILSAAAAASLSYGATGKYLAMGGYAKWRFLTSFSALVVLVIFMFLLVPEFGGNGGALAVLISTLFSNTMAAVVIWKFDRFPCITWELTFSMLGYVSALVLAAFNILPVWAALVILIVISAYLIHHDRDIWIPIMNRAMNGRGRAH